MVKRFSQYKSTQATWLLLGLAGIGHGCVDRIRGRVRRRRWQRGFVRSRGGKNAGVRGVYGRVLPAASQGFDQLHGGEEALLEHLIADALVIEERDFGV